MARYQSIIDVLVDDGGFERVYFDHETELPIPYREIGFHTRNALQEHPGKGRGLHKKWADICAIRNGKARVLVEEERRATEGKVTADIDTISKCKYDWTDDELFPFDPKCVLFILLYDNVHNVHERVIRDKGSLKVVVVCNKESFREKYAQHGVSGSH